MLLAAFAFNGAWAQDKQNLNKEITRRLKDEILLTPRVKLVGKGVIPQSDGKAKRVNDLRHNH